MNDLAFLLFVLEVRNLKGPHSGERQNDRLVSTALEAASSQLLPYLSQRTENPRPIKPLALTVFTVICHGICHLRAASKTTPISFGARVAARWSVAGELGLS